MRIISVISKGPLCNEEWHGRASSTQMSCPRVKTTTHCLRAWPQCPRIFQTSVMFLLFLSFFSTMRTLVFHDSVTQPM
jgi:hypothetical protein